MPDVVGRLRMPRLDVAPANPRMGEMFFHQIKRVVCFWDGTVWVDIINLSPVPYARMGWTGAVNAPGSAHCSCGTSPGTSALNVTLNVDFHSGDQTQMDLGKGRLYARRAGLYLFNAACSFEPHADDRARGCGVRFNDTAIGSIVAATVPSIGAGLATNVAVSGIYVMNAGDYGEITFYQGTGAPLAINAIRFSFAFMSPAAP